MNLPRQAHPCSISIAQTQLEGQVIRDMTWLPLAFTKCFPQVSEAGLEFDLPERTVRGQPPLDTVNHVLGPPSVLRDNGKLSSATLYMWMCVLTLLRAAELGGQHPMIQMPPDEGSAERGTHPGFQSQSPQIMTPPISYFPLL